jgi:plasmid stabilization system protein ParE
MARKKVVWTKNAEVLFVEILEFYTERNQNKVYSRKLVKKVKTLVSKLSNFPEIGFMIENTIYREVIFDNYSIIYTISEFEIVIKMIWDNRRDPNKLDSILI